MITHVQARALRRLLLVAAALTGTLVAHAACADGGAPTTAAPLVWGSLVCLAVLGSPRTSRRWRAWSSGGLLVRLMALELSLHLTLATAPWALGLTVHHQPPLLGWSVLVAHGLVVVVLWLLLIGAQGAIAAAIRVAKAVRSALHVESVGASPSLALPPDESRPAERALLRLLAARGPPVVTST